MDNIIIMFSPLITATDLKVDGGYGAMSAEGLGNKSVFAGCSD